MDYLPARGEQMRQDAMRTHSEKQLKTEISKSAKFGFVLMQSNHSFALLYRGQAFETKTGKKQ